MNNNKNLLYYPETETPMSTPTLTTSSGGKTGGSPKTGGTIRMAGYAVLALVAVVALILLVRRLWKRKGRDR